METIGPYDESLFGAEDYDYWLRVAGMFKLRALRRELYVYRVHGESLTTTQRDRVLNARERLLRRHLPTMSWASRAARGRGWVIAASISFRRGQVGSAVGALGRALVLNPRYVALHLIRGLLLTGSAALLPRGVRTVD